MRSLYARMAVASIGTLLVAVVGLVAIVATSFLPAVVRTHRSYLALQADHLAGIWVREGHAVLQSELDLAEKSLEAQYYLLDAAGRDALTGEDRSQLADAGRQTGLTRLAHADRLRISSIVVTQPSSDGRFQLVVVRPLPFGVGDVSPYIAVVAVVALLTWWLAVDIVKPVRQLATTLQRFGQGHLDERSRLDRRDEIGALACAFNRMADRIGQQRVAERRLFQDVSHELRSPLTRLHLAIELLRTAERPLEALSRLEREADRLTDLVGTLLEVVRLDDDAITTSREPVMVAATLAECINACDIEARVRDVTLKLDGEGHRTLPGSTELLRRAFDNVLRNAVRYAPAGSTVNVTYLEGPDAVEIRVRDAGPGVPSEALAQLGQAFYRVDPSRATASGGVGLGLAIAFRAVSAHGGTTVVTNANPGLCVTITLPAASS